MITFLAFFFTKLISKLKRIIVQNICGGIFKDGFVRGWCHLVENLFFEFLFLEISEWKFPRIEIVKRTGRWLITIFSSLLKLPSLYEGASFGRGHTYII